jgi:hypothetical protein
MESTLTTSVSRRVHGWIYLSLVWIIAGLLFGCDPRYAYKHREYADPDDELYGARQVEPRYAQIRKDFLSDSRAQI